MSLNMTPAGLRNAYRFVSRTARGYIDRRFYREKYDA